jgi:2-dehydropantoate 2-reductase
MQDLKLAVIGLGATGSVVASALLNTHPETFLVGRKAELRQTLALSGLRVSGALDYRCEVRNYISGCAELADARPDVVFLCTKTFHLSQIVSELKKIHAPGMKIVAAQNGLGPDDFLASEFGAEDVWRMSLNLGAALKGPGRVETAFFNRPNHLGCMSEKDQSLGKRVARLLTECGLDTEFVDDINRYVWRKMVMKCTMSAVCAVTDLTFREALEFQPTREIADACIAEALNVARSLGYEFENGYARQAIDYLLKAGSHKDSMCQDIANKLPTEIDFLGAKVVDYGRANGVPTPHFATMTNLVKAIEARYLGGPYNAGG